MAERGPLLMRLLLFPLLCTECSEVVRVGAEVTVVCGEVQLPQTQCKKTDWVKAERTTVELFKLGRPGPEVSSDLSSLLSLTDCGLKIQDVQTEDGADYLCQQYESPVGAPTSSVPVRLTVVSLTEEEEQQSSKLDCEVFSPVRDVRVRWLYQGRVVEAEITEKRIPNPRDRSIVIVPDDHFLYKEKHLFKCEVIKEGKSHIFSFIKEAPGERIRPEPEDPDEFLTEGSTDSGRTMAGVLLTALLLTLVWAYSSEHVVMGVWLDGDGVVAGWCRGCGWMVMGVWLDGDGGVAGWCRGCGMDGAADTPVAS
uniref:Ig-like domain-containing protein n=1 Tax=Knipowitschia caucasica TaxID=637954 RepID=A0AAV2JC56_KNICA